MSELYNERANEYAEVIKNNIYNSMYDRPSLLSLINNEKFESCLDMGCGPGAYIEKLKNQCQKITAVDLSPKFINMVSKNHPDVIHYICDLNNGLPKEKDNTFDLVISPLTIHYIKNLVFLFREVNRVLKNQGTFIFSTHHPFVDFQDTKSGNYFDLEKLTQMWNTLGDETEVTFYRRALTDTFNALFRSGFVIDGFSEGNPSEDIKKVSESTYKKLLTKPQFIFVKVKKTYSLS